jgi:hypothetical protein
MPMPPFRMAGNAVYELTRLDGKKLNAGKRRFLSQARIAMERTVGNILLFPSLPCIF